MFLKKFLLFSCLLILLGIAFSGCGGTLFNDGILYADMTPKQKVSYFMEVYNTQYDDYLYVSSKEGLTEEDKKVLRIKKDILHNLYAAIQSYDAIVILGQVPTQDMEDEVLKFINDILYGTKGGT